MSADSPEVSSTADMQMGTERPPSDRLAMERARARTELALFGVEVTVVDGKARRELGYTGAMTHQRGLAELARPGA